nr:dynein-1-beta heavy chain, flagellar inner arm I1 complex-like [Bombus vancouverensis nearcticus]
MIVKKERKSEILKKSDKTMDTHREFLDMDTDEEDFGHQESPDAGEEFVVPSEPEKPIFSEKDLIALVKYVKDLTIYSCNGVSWNEHSDETIQEYFKNPSYTVLTTFYDKDELNAMLDIPIHASKGFTYFLRSSWQIYTPENFLKTVSFGSINNNIKSNVLKFVENMYAPIVLHSEDYASFLRNDVFLNLHEFIVHLMEEVYKPMDRTILYVPKERLLQTFLKSDIGNYFLLGTNKTTAVSEEDERKRKLVDRLEKVVCFWIRQIRRATMTSMRRQINNIQDEVDYWNAKHSNLNHLCTQLLNTEVRLIIDILKNLHSPSASELEKLTIHIDARLEEASSNLMYLNILLRFCKNLNIPEDVENSVTEALLLILFIWTESSFYSTKRNIKILCRALSSQIMEQCKRYIKLDVALGSNPEMGIQMLEKCIFCCNVYKTIYDNVMINVTCRINLNRKWDINQQEVFSKINIFKQRCYDVIEICEALIVFGRDVKIGLIGGPNGTEYEAYLREIESLFYENLNEIIMARDIVFDVTGSIWFIKIKQFRYMDLQLENMVVNLINDIFKNVKNIEEGIEAIYVLQKFKKRENLRELLQKKWIQIWKIFNNEIEYCYISAINRSREETDVGVTLLCILQYLRNQHSIMTNALDWIGDCDFGNCVLQRYEHVVDVIDKRRKMFNIYNTNGTQYI